MEPERAVALVEIVYWKCCVSEHRHKKAESAAKCIRKFERKPTTAWTKEKKISLKSYVESGLTYKQIGAKFNGISGGRIGQVLWQAIRARTPYEQPYDRARFQQWIDARNAELEAIQATGKTARKALKTAP